MNKKYIFFMVVFLLLSTLYIPVFASGFDVSLDVSCDDDFTKGLINGYVLRELRNIQDINIIDKKNNPQVELSIIGVKNGQEVAMSIMKVQHVWSEKTNPRSGKHDYMIGRVNHYVSTFPFDQLKQVCSEIVTEFEAVICRCYRAKL